MKLCRQYFKQFEFDTIKKNKILKFGLKDTSGLTSIKEAEKKRLERNYYLIGMARKTIYQNEMEQFGFADHPQMIEAISKNGFPKSKGVIKREKDLLNH